MFTAISRSVEAWSADADARAKAASVYEMPLKYGIKDRQPNWKDTNMAFFGTELEKKIKHEASMHEPQWREAGKVPGLQLWRIEQFRVVPWPAELYGQFHEADAYILLHTYMIEAGKLSYSVHFWIGHQSTADKYGTAAYKTVELDDYLHGAAVQHREVQDCESLLFLSYFPEGLTYLAGGTESGFRHVEHFARPPALLWVKGLVNDVLLTEVDVHRHSMNSGDVFVLDCDEGIFQWNGRDSNGYERARAAEVCATMHAERGKSKVTVYEEGDERTYDMAGAFCKYLPTGSWSHRRVDNLGYDKSVARAEAGGNDWNVKAFPKAIFRLHVDEDKGVELELVAQGYIPRTHLDSQGVFVIDSGFAIFLWVGQDAPVHERVAVFVAGHIYVHEHGRPACLPVTHYRDGYETHQFWRIFPDPPQLELAPVTNNYDKYANAYIDVSTQSCVTPSNAWERKIPKSLYSAHAWALSEYLAAGLGDARIADLSYGQLKDFLTVSGKCLRAELDWARTKFALVVLTEMKSIDLTPLLNTCGPPKPLAQLDSRFDVEQGADPEDAAAARETALDYRRAMGDTAKRVHRAATAARERAIQASNAEKADLHAELAALASTGMLDGIKKLDREIWELEAEREEAALREAMEAAIRKAEREARARAAAAAAAHHRADEAARRSERMAREARDRAELARRRAVEAQQKVEAEIRLQAERRLAEQAQEDDILIEEAKARVQLEMTRRERSDLEDLGAPSIKPAPPVFTESRLVNERGVNEPGSPGFRAKAKGGAQGGASPRRVR